MREKVPGTFFAFFAAVLSTSAFTQTLTLTTAAQFDQGEFYACESAGAGAAGVVRLRPRAVFPVVPACGSSVWCLAGLMPAAIADHAAVVVGGRLYVLGGSVLPLSLPTDVIRFVPVANIGLGPAAWTLSPVHLGQGTPGGPTLAISGARAVAAGGRIYLAGGKDGTPGVTTGRVWSSLVDPVSGQPGYWNPEPPLLLPVQGHAFVESAGALFVLGGVDATGHAVATIQKAEIRPDGSLGPWLVTGTLPSSPCAAGGCLACCANGTCPGWSWIDAAAVGRSIMFFGGNRTACGIPAPGDVDHDSWAMMLDDANGPGTWRSVAGLSTYTLWDYRAVVTDGLAMTAGGNNISSASNAVSWTSAGLDRDTLTPDGTGLLPPAGGGTRMYANLPPQGFPKTATGHQLVVAQGTVYLVGGSLNSSASNEIYGAVLGASGSSVNAASWLSAPMDLGTGSLLKRVAWTVHKYGGANDDWAVVRYRVADEGGTWSDWSPRIPEEGAPPTAPGVLAYDSSAGVLMRVPLFPQRVRWVQVMVDLYSDPALPSDPEFEEFTVVADPAPAPQPMRTALELYPVPASDFLVARLSVVSEGAEIRVKLFNAAAHLAAEDTFQFQDGGIKEISLPVSRMARGAYVVIVDGLARSGGPGLFDGTKRVGTVKGKALIRR